MNLTDSQKKIFAILFAAGEPLETDRLAEALAISHAEAAEQCVLLQQRLAERGLPVGLRRLPSVSLAPAAAGRKCPAVGAAPAGKQLAAVHHCRL